MEAIQFATLDDLLSSSDERVELIDAEIVRRPMARIEHGRAQGNVRAELDPLYRRGGPDGWWIVTEVSVSYNEHQCPSHDLAGWRRERVPQRPSGVMTIRPDWVCEILSPGHEKKDLLHHFMLLQRATVPFYWVLSPEDRTLIAYALDNGSYRVIESLEVAEGGDLAGIRIAPFEEVEIDWAFVFGIPPEPSN
ncbi:MAG: Uma2 family endonuclease [Thiohalocapsa sp.]